MQFIQIIISNIHLNKHPLIAQIALSNRHLALKLIYVFYCTASIVKSQLANIVFNGDLQVKYFGEVFKNIS